MKNTIVGLVVASALIALPFAASAQTLDLQSQINGLLDQIKALQQKIVELVASANQKVISANSDQVSGRPDRICVLLNRNLVQGAQGDDVSGLQEFLSGQGFLNASATGFFGPLTAKAVASWQSSQGISSVGTVGPISRERIKIWCGGGGGGTTTDDLKASPTSGTAPLAVNFWYLLGDSAADGYSIDFGDGSSAVTPAVGCAMDPRSAVAACPRGLTSAHTYSSNGTYTATLTYKQDMCHGAVGCMAPMYLKVVGKAQIIVGDTIQQKQTLSADPQSGSAPLTVTFTTRSSIVDDKQFVVEFGDGEHGVMTKGSCIGISVVQGGQGGVFCSQSVTHTYNSRGAYTATLSPYISCLYSNPRCMIAVMMLDQVTIKVGDGAVTCRPLTYMPIACGDGAQSQPVKDANGCTTGYVCPVPNFSPDASCKTWFDGCNDCGRTSPDAPAACTLKYCFAAGKGYCTAHFDSTTTNKPPVISSFSGPTTLSVNQTGTWSIQASDPENGTLSYHVTWGDETAYPLAMGAMMPSSDAFVQRTTFTHAYSSAGAYTVQLNVRDSAGMTADTSTTVKVGSDTTVCTANYEPVCGRPNGCGTVNCPAGTMCPMYCRLQDPQTYSNRCMMNAGNATLVHTGVCTSADVGVGTTY